MRRRQLLQALTGALTGGLLALTVSPVHADEKKPRDKVVIGQLRIISPAMPAIAKGHLERNGIDAEIVFFRSGAELLPALARGQIDAAYTSPGAALFNSLGRGIDLKLVGDWISYPKGSTVNAIVADDAAVTKVGDLKGKSVAITAIGQLTHYATGRALEQAGLKPGDVKIVSMPYPDTVLALPNHVIAAGNLTEPYVSEAKSRGIAHVIAPYGDIAPDLQGGVLVFGKRLLTSDRGLGQRLHSALRAGAADMIAAASGDAATKANMAVIFNTYVPLKDAQVYQQIAWPLPKPSQKLNAASLADQAAFFTAQRLLDRPVDVPAIIDENWN